MKIKFGFIFTTNGDGGKVSFEVVSKSDDSNELAYIYWINQVAYDLDAPYMEEAFNGIGISGGKQYITAKRLEAK